MICPSTNRDKVYVVDAEPGDYRALIQEMTDADVEFTFFGSGRDALRTNPDDSPRVWIVNMKLSDMPGTDLYSMLRSRGCNTPVLMIGDAYDMEDEMSARTSGATLYFTKPLPSEWLFAAGAHAA